MKKIAICTTEECQSLGKKEVTIEGQPILIIYSDGKYYAIDSLCPHAKTRLISGRIEDETLTCANHGICFDLSDGAIRLDKIDEDLLEQLDVDNLPFGSLKIYPLTIENGMIMIEI
ncbi:MAG: Rieske (2Fe-2S) protein [Bacteroidales bacterium]|nr:Rieske (2Fe-2S) protein [Bacteroidales bacterium]